MYICTHTCELAYVALRIYVYLFIYIYEQNIKLSCNKPRAGSSSKFMNFIEMEKVLSEANTWQV